MNKDLTVYKKKRNLKPMFIAAGIIASSITGYAIGNTIHIKRERNDKPTCNQKEVIKWKTKVKYKTKWKTKEVVKWRDKIKWKTKTKYIYRDLHLDANVFYEAKDFCHLFGGLKQIQVDAQRQTARFLCHDGRRGR